MTKRKYLMPLSAALVLCGSLSALQAFGLASGTVEVSGGSHSASVDTGGNSGSVEVSHGAGWDWIDKEHNHYFDAGFNYNKDEKVARWPYAHYAQVRPAYTDESYREWNNLSRVHGYPIAIQFNPDKSGDVHVDHFVLRDSQGVIVEAELAKENLNDREYAIVPRHRLDWDTEYSVDFAYHEDGIPRGEYWTFRTQKLDHPIYRIDNHAHTHDVARGSTYTFYTVNSDASADASFQHNGGFSVEKTVDHDTFYVGINTQVGANVDATVNGEKHHFHVFTDEVKDLEFTNVDDNSVTLRWQHDNSGEERGYKIYRDDKLVAKVSADTRVYTDKGVKPGVHYRYTVKVTNDS